MSLVSSLRHFLVPHHTNNHRAKALHIDSLLTYILVFALLNLGLRAASRTIPDVLGYATDIHTEQLLSGTNAQRSSAGLPPLTLNSQLSAAAAAKATDMFAKNYWAHNSPSGATPWDFIVGSGYHYTVAGENLAKNFSTSQAVVDAWMASPTHRANVVKPNYKEVGFAVVNGVLNGEETTLVVQMFGAASGSIAQSAPTAAPKPIVVPTSAAQDIAPVVPDEEKTLAYYQPVPSLPNAVVSGFGDVTRNPIFNIPTVSRDIVFAFLGIMMGILLVDAWVVGRRHVVRIAGHNIAHIFFLITLFIFVTNASRGRLL